MALLITVVGFALLVVGAVFGRRAGAIEERLVQYRTPAFEGFEGRWPAPADGRYRTEAWPLVTSLRRQLALCYSALIVGAMLLMYACPRLGA